MHALHMISSKNIRQILVVQRPAAEEVSTSVRYSQLLQGQGRFG